jgi:hypothetical protein
MRQRLIVRLLDGVGALLGWTEIIAHAKGDGQLWTIAKVSLAVDEAGAPASVSTHWPDINVETRVAWPYEFRGRLQPGETVTLYEIDQPIMRVGPMPPELPPVTVKAAVRVNVPVGDLIGRT